MTQELPFTPFPLLSGYHQQTIVGSFFNFAPAPASTTKYIHLPDQDLLAMEVSTPKNWKTTDPTVLMIHGLGGSHNSPYLIRMTHKLLSQNIRAIRLNMRGCGSGRGIAKRMYHAGLSGDAMEALKVLKAEYPLSDLTLMGFSLGGNIVLKMAGEFSLAAESLLKQVIAVNSPVDLFTSCARLSLPDNQIYENYFLKLMRYEVEFYNQKFPDLGQIILPHKLNFIEFDNLYTAPIWGFKDAFDYYAICSAKRFIGDIKAPCKILYSLDDPIINAKSYEHLIVPKNIEIFHTRKGGHMGYLATPGISNFYWMDHLLVKWIKNS